LDDVASLYGRSQLMRGPETTFAAFLRASREARIIHVAAHTDSGGGETALVFAPAERVSWKSIAASRLGQPAVVVLAACETLQQPAAKQARALSIGQAFAAAGAREVVGTLAPIADRESRAIFRVLHQELASGTSTALALQRAQLDARSRHSDAWADVELLTTVIPR
jgi:CHAT domain-containing protein